MLCLVLCKLLLSNLMQAQLLNYHLLFVATNTSCWSLLLLQTIVLLCICYALIDWFHTYIWHDVIKINIDVVLLCIYMYMYVCTVCICIYVSPCFDCIPAKSTIFSREWCHFISTQLSEKRSSCFTHLACLLVRSFVLWRMFRLFIHSRPEWNQFLVARWFNDYMCLYWYLNT